MATPRGQRPTRKRTGAPFQGVSARRHRQLRLETAQERGPAREIRTRNRRHARSECSSARHRARHPERSNFTLGLLIEKGALDGLPDEAGRAWVEHCLIASSAASMGIDGLFHPQPPSAFLGGYVLTDQTHAWMLRVPFLALPDPVLLPTLTARFKINHRSIPSGFAISQTGSASSRGRRVCNRSHAGPGVHQPTDRWTTG